MPNNIVSSRSPLVDPDTGIVSREWYNFFLTLFNLTDAGSNVASLTNLQLGPSSVGLLEKIAELTKTVSALPKGPASAFRAYRAAALSVPVNSVIIMDTVEHDNLGEYSVVTGGWTATVSGWYILDAGVALVTSQPVITSLPQLYLTKNGNIERYLNAYYPLGVATGPNMSKPTVSWVTAGEVYKVVINVSNAPSIVTGTANTWFAAVQVQ